MIEGLTKKVVRGGIWVLALRIIQRIFNLIRLIILARLLSPNAFGLAGIALLFIGILETFFGTGFFEALIQKKEDIKPYLDVAWTAFVIKGLILFSILYLLAPYVAILFKAPEAGLIIKVIGISIFNIGVVYFRKELEFNKEFLLQLSATLADFLVAVPLALFLKSAWALVFGILAASLAKVIVSYLIHPYRPRLNLELKKIKELFGFGRWIFGSSILVFLLNHGDDLVVGSMLGPMALGLYQMAFRISNMPTTEYAKLISAVSFPAYSKLQDQMPRLREAYLKILQLTTVFVIPISGLIFVLAPDFTRIFLGQKWMPMVLSMQILSIYGLVGAVGISGPLFMAIGKPQIRTKLQAIALLILVILIYPLTKQFGIVGAASAITIAASFIFVAIYVALNILKSGYKKPFKIFFVPAFCTVIMLIAIVSLKKHVLFDVKIVNFFILASMGGITYLFSLYCLDRLLNCGFLKLAKETLRTSWHKQNEGVLRN
jgi:O-antigen/teichoic acid export membrane protein